MILTKKTKLPVVLTKEQMDTVLESHENLQAFIDLANKLRKNGTGQNMDYFNRIFMQAEKFV